MCIDEHYEEALANYHGEFIKKPKNKKNKITQHDDPYDDPEFVFDMNRINDEE